MKYSLLVQIVNERAEYKKECAAHQGEWGDGGAAELLQRLRDYKDKLVRKLDLRPSEFHLLNDHEVGEPSEFYDVIDSYKIQLARNMKL